MQVQSDAPQRLISGQSIKVHASATCKRGDPAANLRAYAHYAPYRGDGLTVDPFAFVEPDANAAHDFTVTTPSQAWPDSSPLRLQVMLYSTAGIGEVDSDFQAQTLPIHCGPASGELFGLTDAKLSWQLNGCDADASGQLRACSAGYSDVPSRWNVGFSIAVPNPASGEAKAHWLLLAPGVGDQKGTCGVQFVGNVPYEKTTQTVPLARLLATDPQTFVYSDSIHLDKDGLGRPASIDYDWSFSITAQRQ